VKKRLFIGLDICDEARNAAAVLIDELTERSDAVSAKWERPEKLHITLKFLGSVEERLVGSLTRSLREIAYTVRRFPFEISGTGAFPSVKNPRVLWLGIIEQTRTLNLLAERIDAACDSLGFERETRPFKPHLTIARLRQPLSGRELASAHSAKKFGPIQCFCSELVLFESHLGRGGSVYTKLATAEFKNS